MNSHASDVQPCKFYRIFIVQLRAVARNIHPINDLGKVNKLQVSVGRN